jgi:hypothetical protein
MEENYTGNRARWEDWAVTPVLPWIQWMEVVSATSRLTDVVG